GALWGTMYIPYRKAYISGMNPLSFVTIFTVGELGTTLLMALIFQGGPQKLVADLSAAKPAMFWLFLGGFCWVIGDLFQQYAAKYIGIGRGIPLSNTNQLWGLAWGALVFGELAGLSPSARWMVISGSLVMILGAAAISFAEAPVSEQASWKKAMERECSRYKLQPERVSAILQGDDPFSRETTRRSWWELLVAAGALGIFVWLAFAAKRQPIDFNIPWMIILSAATLGLLAISGGLLWKRTRFS
ncbi:MAG: GRP family sugar transporter, partial [Acidobacteriota bacterium]|nr:GRP family sugar transporter [Acidobacteriota bacterium]